MNKTNCTVKNPFSLFVKAENKALAYEKANTILEFVNLYNT